MAEQTPPADPGAKSPVENPFPASAQWTLSIILGVVLLLLSWRACSDRSGTRPTEVQNHRADLNHASRSELQQLPGVGPNRADALLAYRDAKDGFSSAEDLKKVKGFGSTKQHQLQPFTSVSDEPVRGEEPDQLTRKRANPSDIGSSGRGQKPLPEAKININQASIAELQKLPGIGPAMSQRIVDERNRKAFEKIEDLRRVSGIGAKTLDKLRPYVTVED
jgi:competence protein ComEA